MPEVSRGVLTVPEAGRRLGLSPYRVRGLLARRELVAGKSVNMAGGQMLLVDEASVEAYRARMDAQSEPPRAA